MFASGSRAKLQRQATYQQMSSERARMTWAGQGTRLQSRRKRRPSARRPETSRWSPRMPPALGACHQLCRTDVRAQRLTIQYRTLA